MFAATNFKIQIKYTVYGFFFSSKIFLMHRVHREVTAYLKDKMPIPIKRDVAVKLEEVKL